MLTGFEEGGVLVDIPEGFKKPAPQNAATAGTQTICGCRVSQ